MLCVAYIPYCNDLMKPCCVFTTHHTEMFTCWPVASDALEVAAPAAADGVLAELNEAEPPPLEKPFTPRTAAEPAALRSAEPPFAPATPEAAEEPDAPVCAPSVAAELDCEVAGFNTADCAGKPCTYCWIAAGSFINGNSASRDAKLTCAGLIPIC